MWQDFKKFAFKGNILDLALAVIIGGAFGKIVSSLVNDLIMPIIGVLLGGIDFSKLSFTFDKAVIKYGSFIQTVVDFFIITLSLFFVLRVFLKSKKKEETKSPSTSVPSKEELLLTEIRDLLKENLSPSDDPSDYPVTIKKQDE